MTNSEQRRLTHWRLRLLQAAKTRATWPGPVDISGFLARRSTNGDSATTSMVISDLPTELGRRITRRAPHPRTSWGKILYLWQHYHFGPGKIADYLKRFHSLSIACASVHRILRKRGMNRLPPNQKYRRHAHRWMRYEKAQPGHRLQMDVKFLERILGTRRRNAGFTLQIRHQESVPVRPAPADRRHHRQWFTR
jgi:hypothetical protein